MVKRGALVTGCVTKDMGKSFEITCPVTKQKIFLVREGDLMLGEIK